MIESSTRPLQLLAGIRVASFTQFLLGPFAAQYLADMGAEVIKVEPPVKGAWERSWAPGDAWPGGVSVLLLLATRNVKSLSVNLKAEQGRALARRLIAQCDVLVQNFRPDVLDRFGLGYDELAKLNPRLIYASASGYGRGAYRDLPGQDLLIQAESGLAWLSSHLGQPPAPNAAAIIDIHSGTLLALGVLGALVERSRTGLGQKVEVTMMQAAFDLQAEPIAVYLNGGRLQRPTVPLASAYGDAPYGIYPTADGFLALSDSPLKDVIGALGKPDSLRAFEDGESVADRSEDIYRALAAVLVGKSTSEWVGQLRAKGVWCAPAIAYDELMADPLVQAVDPVAEVSHPRAGQIRIVRHPISYSSGAAVINWVGPTVGEHSDEILRGLNYSAADISALKEQGIV